jgi:glyoxylase-like metal-dependent hydrolase (beta-lactamase superfamily II)
MANLRAAGYQPEQVDEIYITHLGPDHVGGLTAGTARAFPNATVRAAKGAVDLFLDPGKGPAWTKNWVQFWADLFQPYIKAGRFSSFSDDIVLTPGIRSLATPGHAPGHTSYVVESKGQTLIVLGDLVLLQAMQFEQPSLTSAFDSDPKAAAAQRQRILQLASEKDDWIAGAHLSFPGIGHVRDRQGSFYYVPSIYMIPK